MVIAKKNAAYYFSFAAVDSTTPESFKTGLTVVDTAYYKDGAGSWTALAITDTFSEIGTTGVYEIDLTAAEMNHDKVLIKMTASGMADDYVFFDLRTKLVSDLNDIASTDIVSGGAINTTAGAVDNVTLTDTTTTNTDMRGTDNAALASVVTETRLSELDAATAGKMANQVDIIQTDTTTDIPATLTNILADTAEIGTAGAGLTDLGGMSTAMKAEVNAEADTALADYDGPTNAELIARTLAASEYFDPATDTVTLSAATHTGAVIPTVSTLTGHTPQTGDTFAQVGASGAGLTDLGGMSVAMKAEILAEVQKLLTTQMTESYAADGVAPTLTQALMLIQQVLTEFEITGTSNTIKMLDGTTTAAVTTLNDAGSPTGATRTS